MLVDDPVWHNSSESESVKSDRQVARDALLSGSSGRDSPVVDVLIPVYNGASTVEGSIRSILEQTLLNLRVIVVDDGSTDATPGILKALASADSRVVVLTTENRGIVDALNHGLNFTCAKYVARHDADDFAFASRLRKQADYLDATPSCVALGANAFHVDVNGNRTGHTTTFGASVSGDPVYVPSVEPYMMHPFLMVRRDALVRVGGYRHVFHSEDTDLYWRLSAEGALANLVESLGEYRVHAGSISSSSIVNGRVTAVNSQLAAISERRRRLGLRDIDFAKSKLNAYESAQTFEAIVRIASAGLRPAERDYLEVASAAKLLEMSSYRPYRLSGSDLETIRLSIERHYASVPLANRLRVVFRFMLGPRRWLRSPLEAWRLIPWKIMARATIDLIRLSIRTLRMAGDPMKR